MVKLSIRDKDAFALVAVATRHVTGQTSEKGPSRIFLNVDCESDGRKLIESDGLDLVESDGASGCGIHLVLWKQIRRWERQDGVHETAPASRRWRWCRILPTAQQLWRDTARQYSLGV